jgi:hypothetical protein
MAPLAHGQANTGTISGSVVDKSNAVIPGATVTLTSESTGLVATPLNTNELGLFVFPNLAVDNYTVQVELPSFKTAKISGVAVTPGSTLRLAAIQLELGGTSDLVEVRSEAVAVPLQIASGEKSFLIDPTETTSLPIENRSFFTLVTLVPGVNVTTGINPTSRIGGGGGDTFMVDGAVTMSSGVNRPSAAISAESIAEVKIVTFGYGAEYGRASGNQINAVTKSGTNQIHGSFYDFERHSAWGFANSQTNILNGLPLTKTVQRDIGWTISGPVGKPGGKNKLFVFWNQEYNPRLEPNAVTNYRMPTALERRGDFSQTTDNLGNPYPYIKDPTLSGTCSATSQAACFKDGGVLGRIPANQLWQTGLNILNWWPLPNCPAACTSYPASGAAYNYQTTYPTVHLLGIEPVVHVDYAATDKLRANFKYTDYMQPNGVIPGRIPGFSDTTQDNFGILQLGAGMNYTLNSTTFLEGSWALQKHQQEGCSVSGGDPNFCTSGDATTPSANRITAGFGAIPYLFPDATLLPKNFLAYQVMQELGKRTTAWDGSRVQQAPSFSFGSRITNTPINNNLPFSSFVLADDNRTFSFSITKVHAAHTIKAGYWYGHLVQIRGTGAITGSISFANDTANPLDTSFGYANAALGIFDSYSQASNWQEGANTQINHEFYIQDNWKFSRNLTLDYGLRFVHEVPVFDNYAHFANFFPDRFTAAAQPRLYTYGCNTGVYPCASTARVAMDPGTGGFVGNSTQASVIVGTLVPNTGVTTNGAPTNGLVPVNTGGIGPYGYVYPAMVYAPRFGFAYSPNERFVVRGATGLFVDRPPGQSTYASVSNPPFSETITVRYGNLQNIAAAGLQQSAPPALSGLFQYNNAVPWSFQWNGGVQIRLPLASTLDVAYTGQHSWHQQTTVNLNTIDYGTAYLPAYQDPTLTNTGVGSLTYVASSAANTNPNAIRRFLGYSTVSQSQPISWETYHSIQLNLIRRLQHGLSFGFNDTIGLYDHSFVAPRLQHNPDGSISIRSDQAEAQQLYGDNHPQRQIMRANVIWQLPSMTNKSGAMGALAYLARDWSLASIWQGATGTAYQLGYSYLSNGSSIYLTGSPDLGAHGPIITGNPGSGCSSNHLANFNTAAIQGPLPGSVGLEKPYYLRNCFVQTDNLSFSRAIRYKERASIVLRVDLYNAFNWDAVTGWNSTAQFASPATNTTITNLPTSPAQMIPSGAGFGVATGYQSPRTTQVQLRFQF